MPGLRRQLLGLSRLLKLSCLLFLGLGCWSAAQAAWNTEEVIALQARLKENSFYLGAVTGVLDAETQAGIDKALEPFPEIKDVPQEKRDYFVWQVIAWYNNAYAINEADAASRRQQSGPTYLTLRDRELPVGRFRLAFREDAPFTHIEHVYEVTVEPERHFRFAEAFINHSNAAHNASAAIAGRYRVGRWVGRQQDTLFFYVTSKRGDVWTAHHFMNLALAAGSRNLPVSLAVDVLDQDEISINGDRLKRVPDPK